MKNTVTDAPTMFTSEQLAQLPSTKVPRHVAIIPDGNRRWAKQQCAATDQGHREGANIIIDTVKAAKELGIRTVTFYLFSTENWSRSKEEIALLMWLLKEFLRDQCPEMIAHGVKLSTIGDLSVFSQDILQAVEETVEKTAHCDKIDMVLALNYGGRDEIRRTIERIVIEALKNKCPIEHISEDLIASYLDTAPWGDPELLIRTSGEMRISNFLLWQLSYTEIYVTNTLWPDFKPHHLLEAVADFQKRERRLGGT